MALAEELVASFFMAFFSKKARKNQSELNAASQVRTLFWQETRNTPTTLTTKKMSDRTYEVGYSRFIVKH